MADDIIVGSAAVEIVPSLRTFATRIRAEIDPLIAKLGKDMGDTIQRKLSESIKEGLGEGFAGSGAQSTQAGRKSGDAFGGAFSRSAKAKIEAALKTLPKTQIGVATSEADQKLKDLRGEMQTLLGQEIGVEISDADAILKIDDLKARLDILANETPSIQVRVDTLAASAQLAGFRAELAALDGGSAGGNAANGLTGSLSAATAATGPLAAGIAVVGAALVPVVASAAGLAASLVLPLAAAGGGLGIGAILAGKAVANLEKTKQKIDQLRKSADTLQDPKAAARAQAQADALEKSLTNPQRAFLAAQSNLSKAFGRLQSGKVGAALFAPLVSGMNLLAKILPGLSPVIESVSKSLVGLLDGLAKSANGKGFTSFVDGFAKLAGTTITTGAAVITNFAKGLFNIFRDFLPLSTSVGAGLTGLSKSFLDFSAKASTKQGIQSFIAYVKSEGPQVLAFFGQTIKSVIRLAQAVAPIGGVFIRVGSLIARAFNAVPIEDFRKIIVRGFTTMLAPIRLVLDLLEIFGVSLSGIGKVALGIGKIVVDVFAGIISGFGYILKGMASAVGALSHVPGFGWTADLAKNLRNAADNTQDLAIGLVNLPKGKVKVDTKDLDKVVAVSKTTDASLRKLFGLPPLRIKVDTKPLKGAQTGTDLLLDRAKRFNSLPALRLKVNKTQADNASLSVLTAKRTLQQFYGVSTKGTTIKINAAAARVARDILASTLALIRTLAARKPVNLKVTTTHYSKDGGTITGGGSTGKVTAIGGIFNGRQDRVIAEAGPEAVVPLNRPLSQVDPSVRWLSAIAQGLTDTGASSARTSAVSAAPVVSTAPAPGADAVLYSVLREFRKGFAIQSDGRGGQRLVLNGA